MNFSFFLREVWRSLTRNAVPSFAAMASVLVTMLVLGAFVPVMQMASAAATATKGRQYIPVYMTTKSSVTAADISRVRNLILSTPDVKSAQFVSKAQALKE